MGYPGNPGSKGTFESRLKDVRGVQKRQMTFPKH